MKREAWAVMFLLLCGCDQPAPAPKGYAGLGQDAGAFKQVIRDHARA